MAGLTLTTAGDVLKEDYQDALREQLNNKVMLLAQVEKNTEDVVGLEAYIALHVQRSSGTGSRAEGGTLPNAGNQTYKAEKVGLKYHYGRIQISGPVIKAMASDAGAFTRAVKSETNGILNDLKRNINRQVCGTSDGVIATCGTTAGTTTVILDTATSAVQLRQLEPGLLIDIATTAAPPVAITNGTARSIVSVNTSTPSVTIDTAGGVVTTTSSHRIYLNGSGGGTTSQKELTGLQTIVASSGSLFNVDPATYPVWASTVDSNSGTNRTISENLIQKNQMATQIASGEDPGLGVASDGVWRSAGNVLAPLKRFNDTVQLKGGFSGINYNAGGANLTLTWDRDAPANRLFGLNVDHLKEYVSSDWEWMDQDGAVLCRAGTGTSGVDAYEATLYKYAEFATDKRSAHFVIKDITES